VVRFNILGPLSAEADDGTSLSVGRPSQRSTLSVLLLRANQQLTKSFLIDALWGDHPPGDADTALRVRISDVRRALGRHNDRLVTRRSGYQLNVQPGELDAQIFAELVSHGRAALDGGAVEDSARLLEQACGLWREPALAELPDTPTVATIVTALLAQRRDAREWLIDARLALGQHLMALAEIRQVIATDPVAEHPYVQLMLALYRCGQKSGALDVYSRLRDLTVREFGQDPGPEARAMLGQVLTDSPELGYRPRPVAMTADPRPAWIAMCQLPAALPDFTGRVAAIDALASRMPASGVAVTVITGPPGVGKTALAIKAAHLASRAFPDGQLYASLGGAGAGGAGFGGAGNCDRAGGGDVREPHDVLGELLRSLGVPAARVPAGVAERAALYRSILAGRKVLVLADDAASAAQVRPLLPGTPGSAVLVTSSSRLADLEGAASVSISGLSTEESIALLGKIAGEQRIAAERAAAAEIAAACNGLPLALRIVGSRLAASPALRLSSLAAVMSDDGRLLGELVIGDLSVRRRLDAAWLALDPYSRQVLHTLAQAGGRELPDSVVMAATAGAPVLAQALVDSSLIIQDPETGDYYMAPLAGCHAAVQPVSAS
jgi:DNA-binding SARP family transcriptional activator